MDTVLEFKCPCCNAPLAFSGDIQQMKCDYCDNVFTLETLQACQESDKPDASPQVQWEEENKSQWNDQEQGTIRTFLCDACGGELITDDHTAATFCPYCGNPTILPGRVSGGLRPEGVIPFKTTKEDAQRAFLNLCKGKPLLPKFFTQTQQVEKITGLYVPFWLYDCEGSFTGSFKATQIHTWSDSKYDFTRTNHFLLQRRAEATFTGIPMDGSSKMEDAFMESIEPFDYSQLVDFDMAYLTGYLADKYDVPAENGEPRIKERVDTSIQGKVQESLIGYHTVVPTTRQLQVKHSKARYVLLPVWILNTKYNDKIYTFAMNGQTGKITGTLPICPKRTALWFAGITAGVTALATVVQWLTMM